MLVELSMMESPVWASVILTVYSLMIPFCWLVGGGDQDRTKEVELTLAATRSSGGALGAETKVTLSDVIFHSHSIQLVTINHTY